MSPKKKTKLQRVSLHLRVDQIERLQKLADSTGASVAEFVRMFVDEGLANRGRQTMGLKKDVIQKRK